MKPIQTVLSGWLQLPNDCTWGNRMLLALVGELTHMWPLDRSLREREALTLVTDNRHTHTHRVS